MVIPSTRATRNQVRTQQGKYLLIHIIPSPSHSSYLILHHFTLLTHLFAAPSLWIQRAALGAGAWLAEDELARRCVRPQKQRQHRICMHFIIRWYIFVCVCLCMLILFLRLFVCMCICVCLCYICVMCLRVRPRNMCVYFHEINTLQAGLLQGGMEVRVSTTLLGEVEETSPNEQSTSSE